MTTGLSTHQGILYTVRQPAPLTPLTAFEHSTGSTEILAALDNPIDTIIFLGGLSDGLQTVPYTSPLASSLPASWRLVETILRSSYRQFGFSSLDEDVAEIEQLVMFFRELRPGGRVVLLGHSTGSQQIMHYLLAPLKQGSPKRARIDGGIMQACISDREALALTAREEVITRATVLAQEYDSTGNQSQFLPLELIEPIFGAVPVTAKRWLSLASPGPKHEGEDDFFSSDLSNERLDRTFGQLGASKARLCWLFSGADEYVPDTVDKEVMVSKWHHYAELGDGLVDEASGIVTGATHTLAQDGEPLKQLIARITSFLERVERPAELMLSPISGRRSS